MQAERPIIEVVTEGLKSTDPPEVQFAEVRGIRERVNRWALGVLELEEKGELGNPYAAVLARKILTPCELKITFAKI